ncbi:hypothetical protein AB0J72_04675 [Dactylosporangium sp. NPDC049742]|uniref:hypothetical protein n=1 Tax=Dactylosporangium sp. NPDC049742 TaxID=3154737 RepID=UPI00343A01FD
MGEPTGLAKLQAAMKAGVQRAGNRASAEVRATAGPAPGERVAAAQELRRLADAALRAAVIAEREDGTSWEVIGGELGTSRSGAHGRFADDVTEWRREHPRTAHPEAQAALGSAWAAVDELARRQLLLDPARLEDAERSLREAADTGAPHAVTGLAELLLLTGRADEAEQLLRTAATAGDADAAVNLADVLHRAGRLTEAEEVLRGDEAMRSVRAAPALAELLHGTGRPEAGEAVLRDAAERGNGRAVTALALRLLDDDRIDEAEQLLHTAAADGDRRAAELLARQTTTGADPAEVLFDRVLHVAGHGTAANLLDAGRVEDAQRMLHDVSSLPTDGTAIVFVNACRASSTDDPQVRRRAAEALAAAAGVGDSRGERMATTYRDFIRDWLGRDGVRRAAVEALMATASGPGQATAADVLVSLNRDGASLDRDEELLRRAAERYLASRSRTDSVMLPNPPAAGTAGGKAAQAAERDEALRALERRVAVLEARMAAEDHAGGKVSSG